MQKFRLLTLSFVLLAISGIATATEHTVPSGKPIQDIIDKAADGDVIILENGGIYETTTLDITKSLTIKAVDGYTLRPVIISTSTDGIKYGGLATGAKITYMGIEFKSDGTSRYLHRFATGDSISCLKMNDVVAHGYDRCIIRASDAGTVIDTVLIENSHFYDFDGSDYRLFYFDGADCKTKYFKATNSSFVDFDRTFLQLNHPEVVKSIVIDHCNIHGRTTERDDDLFDINGPEGSSIRISNTIISSIKLTKIWDIRATVSDSIHDVFYHDIENVDNMTGNTWTYELEFNAQDPEFTNAPGGILYLKEGSLALVSSESGEAIGDPRWVSAPGVATLSRIMIEPGMLNPAFDPATLNYTVNLPYGTDTVTVDAVVSYDDASLTGTGDIIVSSGSGTATLVVTAGDASTQTYTIDITVDPPSSDASLYSLMAFSKTDTFTLVPGFTPTTFDYNAGFPTGTDSIFIEAVPNHDSATMVVTDTIVVMSDTETATVELTAQDGTTSNTYTINLIEGYVGIETGKVAPLQMYYNSAADQLRITGSSELETVEIYNLAGALVSRVNIHNQMSHEIHTGTLTNGLYIVKVRYSDHAVGTGKFVKY